MAKILTPDCPQCRQPPRMVLGAEVFCGNDECTLILWNPSLSLDANLLDSGVVRFPPPVDGT